MRCNESGWLPGQTRDVATDAGAWRVPRSCGAGRAPLTGIADDAPDATGCSRMHRDASRRNYDARGATESAASSLHQFQADHEVPGHRGRAALPADRGTATPHAAPQAARVHVKCRMMHQMQFFLFLVESREDAGTGAGTRPRRPSCPPSPRSGRSRPGSPAPPLIPSHSSGRVPARVPRTRR